MRVSGPAFFLLDGDAHPWFGSNKDLDKTKLCRFLLGHADLKGLHVQHGSVRWFPARSQWKPSVSLTIHREVCRAIDTRTRGAGLDLYRYVGSIDAVPRR